VNGRVIEIDVSEIHGGLPPTMLRRPKTCERARGSIEKTF
jgi:hypothetical protein